MYSRFAFSIVAVFACLIPGLASAQGFDLAPHARVTASGTYPKFLHLWERETDDAPYTVRDGVARTGWKTPLVGESWLQFDFAPRMATAPRIARIYGEWATAPAKAAVVRLDRWCGGPSVEKIPWNDFSKPLEFSTEERAYCLTVRFEDAGPAELTELHIYAAAVNEKPALAVGVVEEIERQGVLIRHDLNTLTSHVEVHYVDEAGTPLTENTLIERTFRRDAWEGPKPDENALAVLVPIAEDGQRGEPRFVPVPGRIAATFGTGGVIEGFYGTPWSHAERRAMLIHLARLGLGAYMHAPKDDEKHRDAWREPYTSAEMRAFFELRDLGARLGVDVYYAIAPGKDMALYDAAERELLLGKLRDFADGGFRHFMLMFDDIENDIGVPVNGALGAAHADLVNFVKQTLEAEYGEAIAMWVNPLAKRPEHMDEWPGGEAYWTAMGATDPDVVLCWGAPTNGQLLDGSYFEWPAALVGRAPGFWDNQFAIDGGDAFMGRLTLAPMQMRAPDLRDSIAGFGANAMFLGAAERLVMTGYGAYLEDPQGYDHTRMIERAARFEASDEFDQRLLVDVQNTFYGNNDAGFGGIDFPRNLRLNAVADAIHLAAKTGSGPEIRAAGASVAREAARMATLKNDLHHSGLEEALVDDVWIPADRATHEGYGLLHLMNWYASVLAGEPDGTELDLADALLKKAVLHDRYQTSFLVAWTIRQKLVSAEIPDIEFHAPPLPGALFDRLSSGREHTVELPAGVEWTVFGLPGATIVGRVLTWTPPHPGFYSMVLVGETDSGWGWTASGFFARTPVDSDGEGDDDDSGHPEDDDPPTDDGAESDFDEGETGGCGC
ncbi:MAG: beta-N-acetylglucosaminidase domain-containing protein [Deltaproteobacteria bacterium]|nr:beta-N-acetylglucosaminidase domain-containing protein [Deltaproteobacteria bacterium]